MFISCNIYRVLFWCIRICVILCLLLLRWRINFRFIYYSLFLLYDRLLLYCLILCNSCRHITTILIILFTISQAKIKLWFLVFFFFFLKNRSNRLFNLVLRFFFKWIISWFFKIVFNITKIKFRFVLVRFFLYSYFLFWLLFLYLLFLFCLNWRNIWVLFFLLLFPKSETFWNKWWFLFFVFNFLLWFIL